MFGFVARFRFRELPTFSTSSYRWWPFWLQTKTGQARQLGAYIHALVALELQLQSTDRDDPVFAGPGPIGLKAESRFFPNPVFRIPFFPNPVFPNPVFLIPFFSESRFFPGPVVRTCTRAPSGTDGFVNLYIRYVCQIEVHHNTLLRGMSQPISWQMNFHGLDQQEWHLVAYFMEIPTCHDRP
jgi:hypothetical protein